jgi:hypothetical protein
MGNHEDDFSLCPEGSSVEGRDGACRRTEVDKLLQFLPSLVTSLDILKCHDLLSPRRAPLLCDSLASDVRHNFCAELSRVVLDDEPDIQARQGDAKVDEVTEEGDEPGYDRPSILLLLLLLGRGRSVDGRGCGKLATRDSGRWIDGASQSALSGAGRIRADGRGDGRRGRSG